ncbi:androgen-induced gene 1 protein-like isoform X1 [Penaeus chinensis]|uniref:androgen-induced gene 1 protein-like isoform X1 n=1 Tax=Penaeus chinensis TaxID=139456 RepID=UPI001FB7E5C7|nr:androgen-induced gene 1 protein-like isoform X1 [Penaeus chinensis]XP_047491214.1 androgen-induced gene 1 protein-like isoform X1 [Penaeus chinensis]
MNVKSSLLHLLVFCTYGYGIYHNVTKLRPPSSPALDFAYRQFGGRLKFLTFLNALLQCGFFGLCVLNDFVGSESPIYARRSLLQRLRDWLFTSLVLPMGVFVSCIFWALYAVDRELIFPASLDSWFPGWLNHIMHTLPAIGAIAELYSVCHCFQKGIKMYYPILVAYFLYLSWICYIAYAAGFWVYPVFEVLDMKGRTIFLAALLLPNLFFVHLGPRLHNMIWGSSTKMQGKRKGKKE